MALALHMFSVTDHDVAAPEAVTVADKRWAWVALALVPGVGSNPRRYQALLRLGSPLDALRASRRALASLVGDDAAASVTALDWRRAMEDQAAAAARCGAHLV